MITRSFEWALGQLRDGKPVRRSTWPRGAHLRFMPAESNDMVRHGPQILAVSTSSTRMWMVSQVDLFAVDWDLV